jgi:hypothetical protein
MYADEEAPPEYGCCFNERPSALAFAVLLTREPQSPGVLLSSLKAEEGGLSGRLEGRPLDFLRRLLLSGKIYASS